jgi:hypothetical protein
VQRDKKIRQAEYKWKKDLGKIKRDRTKDLHPSIKMMIENASAIKHCEAGELSKNFLSLYNSKTHGSLDIQLPQLFEDVGMGHTCGLGSSHAYRNLTRPFLPLLFQ